MTPSVSLIIPNVEAIHGRFRHRSNRFSTCLTVIARIISPLRESPSHHVASTMPCKSAHEGESRHLGDAQSKRSRSRNSQRITKGEISTLGQIERAFSISELL
jgi:hypothetical protein